MRRNPTVGILVLAAIWFGMLAGVSFLATPVKFHAPSLSLPVALDVGRHTFAALNRTEWVLSVVLIGLVAFGGRSRAIWAATLLVVFLVALQTLYLLPVLDARVGQIIAGRTPEPSRLHIVYIGLEFVKLVGLLLIMIAAAKRVAARSLPLQDQIASGPAPNWKQACD